MHTERAQLKLDATAIYTALGLNERLFVCTSSQVDQLVRIIYKRENVIASVIVVFIMVHTVKFDMGVWFKAV